jgi:putative inorganic carbon (hco3(-)) transporter
VRDFLFAFVWIAVLPLLVISAHTGALIWVWCTLLSPNELLYGFMAGIPFSKVAAIPTIFLTVFGKDKKDPHFDVTWLLIILFCIGSTITWVDSISPSSLATDLYEKVIKEMVLALVIATVMTTRDRIDRLVLVIVLSVGFLAVREGLIFLLTAGGHHVTGNGALGDNNGLAMVLLMIVPLTFYLARYLAVRVIRIGMWLVLGLSLVTVIATYSRGGLIGLMVLGAFAVKNSRRRFVTLLIVVLAGGFLYLLTPGTWFERMDTIQSADNDASFMGRVVAWKISLLIAMDHPLFGGGMHAVQQQLVWDTYKQDLDLVNFVNTPPADQFAHAAHSIYFEVLGDLGFVGLTLFLGILGVALWNCRQLYRISRGHPSLAWAADLARMLQISLMIYLTTGAALSQTYLELLYILIAVASRCRRTVRLILSAELANSREKGAPT